MAAVPLFRQHFKNLGYQDDNLFEDYVFSDVMEASPVDRTVALAAFAQTPPSYRNAALAVAFSDGRAEERIVDEYRALGAPLLFLFEAGAVSTWQVRPGGSHRLIQRTKQDELGAVFARNRDDWSPLSIQRAKAIGQVDTGYQLDFVDAGLMPAIEGQIHSKLDQLLKEALATLARSRADITDPGVADAVDRAVFRTTFRLLAAKVLQDRQHAVALEWASGSLGDVLETITRYYSLPELAEERTQAHRKRFESVWKILQSGISFRNISADDLAFVYENTLVTPETRRHFGTHSTPRAIAEYTVRNLNLWTHDVSNTRIYEPFTGAGIFLVAALRQMRDLLPVEWDAKDRHGFLVHRLAGDEVDSFASEVAKLSLVLADYPNANGWRIGTCDLFEDDVLPSRLNEQSIVLSNPPFENFTAAERKRYPAAAARSLLKPASVLSAVLDDPPAALGFVLPRPFLQGEAYSSLRQRVEETYSEIELVSLPDRIFKASPVRSSLLLAKRRRRDSGSATTLLKSTTVLEKDRELFLATGNPSFSRVREKTAGDELGRLWINELGDLWAYLEGNPKLGQFVNVHRGLEWFAGHGASVRDEPAEGFCLGVHAANSVRPFELRKLAYLDMREGSVKAAGNRPWKATKIVANAARTSRGPWCFSADVDHDGLVASQQLFGIWPTEGAPDLYGLAAILNGPIANAFLASHSPPDRIRVSTLKMLPLPRAIPPQLKDLALDYKRLLAEQAYAALGDDVELTRRLAEIEALVLHAYELPAALEQDLQLYLSVQERDAAPPRSQYQLPDEIGLAADRRASAHLKTQLAEAAGGLLTSEDVCRILGFRSEGILLEQLAQGHLLSVLDGGKVYFPALQFEGSRVIDGVRKILAATDVSGWRLLQYLIGTPDGLGGHRPIDLLRAGRDEDAERAIAFARVLDA